MALGFDISVVGDKELERRFARLSRTVQRKLILKTFMHTIRRLKNEVLINLSGRVVQERSGRYVTAMESQSIKKFTSDFLVARSFDMPRRAKMGIVEANGYYPAYLEYGTQKMPAFAPIRKAVNKVERRELAFIADDLARQIARAFKKTKRR
jgi:hypothetical protein